VRHVVSEAFVGASFIPAPAPTAPQIGSSYSVPHRVGVARLLGDGSDGEPG